jgi:DNA-binding protein HU-beta
MNKPELVERLVDEHELTRVFARDVVDSVLGQIIEAVQKGEEAALFGFGTFRVVERAARTGRNPRTGEAVKIAASKAVKFVPSGTLKSSLNKKRRTKKG